MVYIRVYLWIMKNDGGLFIKLPKPLKKHSIKYAEPKGGLSKLVRDLLIKETKFKEQ